MRMPPKSSLNTDIIAKIDNIVKAIIANIDLFNGLIGPARATLTIGSVSAWPFYSFLGGHCGFQEVWGAVARQRVGLERQTHRFLNERGRLMGGR
jgi:hypothetical protein